MPVRRHVAVAVAMAVAVAAGSCSRDVDPRPPAAMVGDAGRGATAIAENGCGACHRIPGISGADGLVGPPLDAWGRRSFIAGALPNTQPNLVAWITDPQSIERGTAMPDLGIAEAEAEDIAAYLLSLE